MGDYVACLARRRHYRLPWLASPINQQRPQHLAQGFGQGRNGSVADPIDVDVDEVPLRGRCLVVAAEDPDLVAYAALADAGDPYPGIDDVGERDRLEEPALRLDHEADDRAVSDI